MERIPCKLSINIDYADLYIGNNSSTYQLFSAVEGTLLILINNKSIFSEKNILLLELAAKLNDWLNNYENNFNYYSMDYEDGPILFFKKETTGCWQLGSIWMVDTYSGIGLSELIYACKEFINKLLDELKSKQINLNNLFLKNF